MRAPRIRRGLPFFLRSAALLQQKVFDGLSESENDQRENSAHQGDANGAEADRYSNRGSHTAAGRRGKSFDFLFAFQLQNRTGPNKANARYQTLNYARHCIECHADTLVHLARVLHESGKGEDAVAAAREAMALYERKGATFLAAKTQGLIEEWTSAGDQHESPSNLSGQ